MPHLKMALPDYTPLEIWIMGLRDPPNRALVHCILLWLIEDLLRTTYEGH